MARFLGIEFVNEDKRAADTVSRMDAVTERLRTIVARLAEMPASERADHLAEIEDARQTVAHAREWLSGAKRLGRLRRVNPHTVFLWETELGRMAEGIFAMLESLRVEAAARQVRDAVEAVQTERGKKPAAVRWARLDSVKEWAFQQRKDDPPPRSRAAVIARILPEVRERARAEGEPLTGDDPAVTRTVTKWFREAGIK